MKTFKLVSLVVQDNGGARPIELVDGLVINKENEQQTWLIEVYTKARIAAFFEEALASQKEFVVEAVITRADNDPVLFYIKVVSVRRFGENASVMLQGKLNRTSQRLLAEALLEELVERGLSGEKLVNEFKQRFKNRPYLAGMVEKQGKVGK